MSVCLTLSADTHRRSIKGDTNPAISQTTNIRVDSGPVRQGGGQLARPWLEIYLRGCFLPSLSFLSFSPRLLPLPSFRASKWPLKSNEGILGECCLLSQRGRTTFVFCSHETRTRGSKYTTKTFAADPWPQTHFLMCLAQGTWQAAANLSYFR